MLVASIQRGRAAWLGGYLLVALAVGTACSGDDPSSQGGSSAGGAAGGGSSPGGGGAIGGNGATGGSGATGGGAGASGGSGGSGGICAGQSLGACDDCLDTACEEALCACTTACWQIEACLEAVCRAITDETEGQCQVYCQDLHPGGKPLHLAVVNCAYAEPCSESCGSYPSAYNECRATMTAGACADEWAACQGNTDCLVYQSCSAACTTYTDCVGCSNDAQKMGGRLVYEAYEQCIARECLAESWAW